VDFIEYCKISQATDKAVSYLIKRGCACISTSVACELDGLHQIKSEITRATEKMIVHVEKVYPLALVSFIGSEEFDRKSLERHAAWINGGFTVELAARFMQADYYPNN